MTTTKSTHPLVRALRRGAPGWRPGPPDVFTFSVRAARRTWEVGTDSTLMVLAREVPKAGPGFPRASKDIEPTYIAMLTASPPQVAVVDAASMMAVVKEFLDSYPDELRKNPNNGPHARVGGHVVAATQLLEALRAADASEVALYYEYVQIGNDPHNRSFWLVLCAPGYFAAIHHNWGSTPATMLNGRVPEVALMARGYGSGGGRPMTIF
jgi:hypothetical protein